MNSGLIAFNELERDALAELVNLGAGRAAASLGMMLGAEVFLAVPSMAVVSRAEAARAIEQPGKEPLVAVHQQFDGELSGRAMLIFPETGSLELVRAITGGTLPIEDVLELEQEALAETGNIILNGCLAAMANMLRRTLNVSLPEVLYGAGLDIFNLSTEHAAEDRVMLFCIDFSVKERDIRGYIAMLMDSPSLLALPALLEQLIARESEIPGDYHAAF